MTRRARLLTTAALVGLAGLLTGALAAGDPGVSSPAPGAHGGPGPLAAFTLAPDARYAFAGEVVEVLDAGSYAYLRVRGEAGERWVATLAATRPEASRVTVRVIGEADHFHSARLGRDFTALAFGLVRAR
jgi:hypothetical protein